eukprot:6183898-Pleurochrysis_carterae.AAC.6
MFQEAAELLPPLELADSDALRTGARCRGAVPLVSMCCFVFVYSACRTRRGVAVAASVHALVKELHVRWRVLAGSFLIAMGHTSGLRGAVSLGILSGRGDIVPLRGSLIRHRTISLCQAARRRSAATSWVAMLGCYALLPANDHAAQHAREARIC